jgi:hypothetical protein
MSVAVLCGLLFAHAGAGMCGLQCGIHAPMQPMQRASAAGACHMASSDLQAKVSSDSCCKDAASCDSVANPATLAIFEANSRQSLIPYCRDISASVVAFEELPPTSRIIALPFMGKSPLTAISLQRSTSLRI